MNEAIELFFYIFNKIYSFLFNEAIIQPNVSVGWIFVTVVIFGLIIRTILNLPSGLSSRHAAAERRAAKNNGGE